MSGIDCATPDPALMRRVSADDECAFEQLYHRYHRRLLDFFYALGRDPQTAEELAADTFARIWHLRKRYAATGSFPAYLIFVCAAHLARTLPAGEQTVALGHGGRLGRRGELARGAGCVPSG